MASETTLKAQWAETADTHLDSILKASGSALRNYTLPSTRLAMRAAVLDAMIAAVMHATAEGAREADADEAKATGECVS